MEEWVKHFKEPKLISIDPGKVGGIAVYSLEKKEIIDLTAMPETPQDLLGFIKRYQNNSRCYLEKVGGIPGQGGAASMFNFGRGFGWIEMALLANKIPTIEVTPQKWQKELQVGSKGKKSTNEWKTKLVQIAQHRWPTVGKRFDLRFKKDWLAIGDALLILEYARLIEIKK